MKIFKSRIFLVIITAIIFMGVGVLAANINADEIEYNNGTVKDALDTLYDVTNKEILNKFDLYLRAWGYSNTNLFQSDLDNIANDSQIKQNYTYFKITNITKNNSGNQCIPIAYDISNSAWQNITENIEYELSDYNNIGIKGYSYQNDALASCSMKVTFYNK